MAINPFLLQPVASARVKGADGTSAAADGNFAKGCTTARTAKGVYTLTLQREVDSAEAVILANATTLGTIVTVAHTSDSVKTISVTDAAAAALDDNFNAIVLRVSGGAGR